MYKVKTDNFNIPMLYFNMLYLLNTDIYFSQPILTQNLCAKSLEHSESAISGSGLFKISGDVFHIHRCINILGMMTVFMPHRSVCLYWFRLCPRISKCFQRSSYTFHAVFLWHVWGFLICFSHQHRRVWLCYKISVARGECVVEQKTIRAEE